MEKSRPIAFLEELDEKIELQGKDYFLWNVFRPLKELKNRSWVNDLFRNAYKANFLSKENLSDIVGFQMDFWFGRKENLFIPPDSYNQLLNKRLRDAVDDQTEAEEKYNFSEEAIEIDLVMQTNKKLIFFQTMLNEDIDYQTAEDPIRDQLSRILDVGSDYAKKQSLEFFFILVTPDLPFGSRLYHYRMHDFFHHPLGIKEKLPHRKDLSWHELSEHIGWVTWEQLLRIWDKYVKEEYTIQPELRKQIKKNIELQLQLVEA